MPTVLDTIDGGTRYLEKRGITDARLSMQLMAAQILGCTRMQLYMDFDKPMTEDQLAPLRENLKQRGEGVPLQHILGEVEFFKRTFKCDNRALVPRPETEELISILLELGKSSPFKRILDLCTGSGVIGLTLAAELPEAEVTCTDISPEALALAKENAETLNLPLIGFIESNAFDKVTGTYDLIVSNPPYVAESERPNASKELHHDPALALYSGADGLDFIRQIIPAAKAHLNEGAHLALEIGHAQSEAVQALLTEHSYQNITVAKDLNQIPRFPIAQKGNH